MCKIKIFQYQFTATYKSIICHQVSVSSQQAHRFLQLRLSPIVSFRSSNFVLITTLSPSCSSIFFYLSQLYRLLKRCLHRMYLKYVDLFNDPHICFLGHLWYSSPIPEFENIYTLYIQTIIWEYCGLHNSDLCRNKQSQYLERGGQLSQEVLLKIQRPYGTGCMAIRFIGFLY